MSEFFVWYFNLSAWGAIEFFFKSLLLMVLFSIPLLVVWAIIKRANNSGSLKAEALKIPKHSGRELAKSMGTQNES